MSHSRPHGLLGEPTGDASRGHPSVRSPLDMGLGAFHGVFHSTAIDNMIQTFEFEGVPGHVALDRLTFEDLGGGCTMVRTHSVYQSVEDRDGMVQSGMADGVNEGFDRLDELLERMSIPA